ncbi:MAG: substrate-binding domain-containing protein, partial [Oscillospiraceae bacterium]|nr:substrate-binding domain-containing protein [Oscillospiraceae bacterium]
TPNAYSHFFFGGEDLIFVTYPSEYELARARDEGIELDIIPVVKDALVFLVNAENPVDSIELEQARDVYTGDITNWKALGGLDADIVPYQRPLSSGSQTLLTKLVMGGVEPMQPPSEWLAETMGSLVEVVSSYDNARDAIGYSVFYYVNNMYGNSRFKLLGVDGVKPSRETIERGEYPLEDYYYAVVRKDTPADSPARKLVDWLLTDDGQTIAARAGYIPLRPLENVFPDETLDPVYIGDAYNSSGTGGTEPKPAEAVGELVVNGVRKPLSDVFYDGFNYILYINSEIMDQMNSPRSAFWYSENFENPSMAENTKRPFTGIPNDYPNYRVNVGGANPACYLQIDIPANNPFFEDEQIVNIRLTADISPYGIDGDEPAIAYRYDYDRRMLPNVDLLTLSVEMPQSPEIAERINSQLKTWTDGFSAESENIEIMNGFMKWCFYLWGDDYTQHAYKIQPARSLWRDYLFVSYPLHLYDGPMVIVPVFDAICFDINTGETVDFAKHLPSDLPYSTSMVSDPAARYGDESSYDFNAKYAPVEGSVVTSAWILGGDIGIYVTEPDGRRIQVNFLDWE